MATVSPCYLHIYITGQLVIKGQTGQRNLRLVNGAINAARPVIRALLHCRNLYSTRSEIKEEAFSRSSGCARGVYSLASLHARTSSEKRGAVFHGRRKRASPASVRARESCTYNIPLLSLSLSWPLLKVLSRSAERCTGEFTSRLMNLVNRLRATL